MKTMQRTELPALFRLIREKQALYIPAEDGSGQAAFQRYEEGMTLAEALNTVRSAKDFFFPQTESLVDFKCRGKEIEIIDPRTEQEDFVLFGVRACDARSFSILDRVFLAEPIDSYYQSRRSHGTIIALACTQPEETCFCTAFGIDPTAPEGDVACWMDAAQLYFKANTEKGERFLASIEGVLQEGGEAEVEAQQKATRAILEKLPLRDLAFSDLANNTLLEHFHSAEWAPLSESCLGCGTCTFVCPTCQCYDIRDFDTGAGVKRFRCWDSCMYSDFTRMAHGNPRLTQRERFRQRFMHKLVYFPENNGGEFGCVGCGRCLAKCPISMNIVKVAKALKGEGK